MNTDIQTNFFYQYNDIASDVIQLLETNEIEPPEDKDSADWRRCRYTRVKRMMETFDDAVLMTVNGRLMPEIEEYLLHRCTTTEEREIVVKKLITEFKVMSNALFSDLVNKNYTIQCEEQKREYNNGKLNKNIRRQITALNNEIRKLGEKSEISKQILETANYTGDNYIKQLFSQLYGMMFMFANRLDAICLPMQIDIFKLQKECNVYLLRRRSLSPLVDFIGSYELTMAYLDKLQKDNSEQNNMLLSKELEGILNGSNTVKEYYKIEQQLIENELFDYDTGWKGTTIELQALILKLRLNCYFNKNKIFKHDYKQIQPLLDRYKKKYIQQFEAARINKIEDNKYLPQIRITPIK